LNRGRAHAVGVAVASLLIASVIAAMEESPFSWRLALNNAVVKAAALVFCAFLAWVSWRVAGAHPGFAGFTAVFAYVFGAWLLIFSFLSAIDAGALKLSRPGLFAQIVAPGASSRDTQKVKALLGSEDTYALRALLESDQAWGGVTRTPGLAWMVSMAALRGVVTLVWLVAAWAAFRSWLGMAWSRAIFSLALFLVLGSVTLLLAIFFRMAPIMIDPGRWLEKVTF